MVLFYFSFENPQGLRWDFLSNCVTPNYYRKKSEKLRKSLHLKIRIVGQIG